MKIIFFITVVTITSYQVLLKILGSFKINSFLVFPIIYFTAFILSLIFFISNKSINSIDNLNLNIFLLSMGLGVVTFIIEFSYFQAFRLSANISTYGMSVMLSSIILMLFIGLYFFNENITWTQVMGVICCIIGLILIKLN